MTDSKGMWGEGNTQDFLIWAEECQRKAMQKRGLHINTKVNYSNISSPASMDAKEKILDIIQAKRKLTLETLYESMSPDMCSNPTTKTLIMQLYYANNIKMEGYKSSLNARETNFSLTFVSRKIQEKRVVEKPRANVTYEQSNIDEIINNDWRATGRKLDFEKFEKETKNLNISLKKEKPRNTTVVNEKPVQDVRNLFKSNVKEFKTTVAPAPQQKQRILEEPSFSVNLPNIDFKIKEEKPIVIDPIITTNPFKVETPKMQFSSDLEFAGLTCFELYLLEMYFFDASANTKEKNKKEYLKINAGLCKTKGDVLYLEEDHKSGLIKFLLILLSVSIITIPILFSYSKNKIRNDAKKNYLKLRKKMDFETITNNFKNKYPKVVK